MKQPNRRSLKRKPRLMIGVNLLSHIPGRAYPYHMIQSYRIGKELAQYYDCFFHAPIQMSIDRMKNNTMIQALELECDYVYIYDVDVLTPSRALHKLLEAKKDIICGLTYVRGYPYPPMIYKYEKQKDSSKALKPYYDFKKHLNKDGLVEVDAVGFSCVLISCDLLRKMDQPFAVTGPRNTEDIYFCVKAKQTDPKCSIYCDTTVQCGHIVDSYWVDDSNVAKLRRFEEVVNGSVPADKDSEHAFRGKKYLAKCRELLPSDQPRKARAKKNPKEA